MIKGFWLPSKSSEKFNGWSEYSAAIGNIVFCIENEEAISREEATDAIAALESAKEEWAEELSASQRELDFLDQAYSLEERENSQNFLLEQKRKSVIQGYVKELDELIGMLQEGVKGIGSTECKDSFKLPKELGVVFHNWHDDMDSVYVVGACAAAGEPILNETAERAIALFEECRPYWEQQVFSAQFVHSYEAEEFAQSKLDELSMLVQTLKNAIAAI